MLKMTEYQHVIGYAERIQEKTKKAQALNR